jgi:4-hydroxybenzoate polyprenyltransferase
MTASVARQSAVVVPVCVDLDGTLITGDLMWESFIALFKRDPLKALVVAMSVLRGRAHFKRKIAEHVTIEPSELLYRREVIDELATLSQEGVPLLLATASHETYARAVSSHLGFFQEVVASDGFRNVSGREKAAALVERFGEKGFDYIGNDWADVPVWRVAATPTVVAGSPSLVRQLTSERSDARVLAPRRHPVVAALIAMRPHQWAKNTLVFIPVIAAHHIFELNAVWPAALTFAAFSLCASAIYILNDIFDIRADRRHPRKCRRPFAAGELSVPVGIGMAIVLLSVSAAIAVGGSSWGVGALLGLYVLITSAYTLRLKRVPVADVFTLTGLYVLRIVAGAVSTETSLTTWLLAFALFFFLGLAFIKRFVEVMSTRGQLPGREYGPEDAQWMQAIGTSASYMAVVVLALYVNTPEVTQLYSHPDVLWLLCPVLLFWSTRLWFRAGRHVVHDDPVVEAIKDPLSYVTVAMASIILLIAAL